jgi:hypothetical protein
MRDDEAERTESSSAGKEHEHPENEHESPVRQESVHSRNAPDDQAGDSGCI